MNVIPLEDNLSSRFDFKANLGAEVRLTGQVQNLRPLSWGGFLVLRLPNHLIQAVVSRETLGPGLEDLPASARPNLSLPVRRVGQTS